MMPNGKIHLVKTVAVLWHWLICLVLVLGLLEA
jgi:hypothetical protein